MRITEAKVHDKNFLRDIQVPEFSMIVFDKVYNYYKQFAQWTTANIYFVTRQKSNAIYDVLQTLSAQTLPDKQAGVLKEEIIQISYQQKKRGADLEVTQD